MTNLTSFKYQDSCIFTEIGSSHGKKDDKTSLERVRSVGLGSVVNFSAINKNPDF